MRGHRDESEKVLETVYSKKPVVIGFNTSYLLDIFKALGGKGEVRMELKDGSSSAPPTRGLQSRVHVLLRPDAGTGLS